MKKELEEEDENICEVSKEEHWGWEFPNKDMICLDCGRIL